MHPLEAYLQELSEIHDSGAAVKETSGYPALRQLLAEVGRKLKPRVTPIIHLRNAGAGIPDGGLFTAEQLKPLGDETEKALVQLPSRAAIEVKAPSADMDQLAGDKQVADYAAKYGYVLLTNYREFRLVRGRTGGKVESLEAYQLAATEKEFWALARHPRKAAQEHGARLADFLMRAMLVKAPINTPKDLAWFLASYAREALARVEHAADVPALNAVRAALEETLGLTFEGAEGEHFFRSTLVQTLFYGVFSAWVLWCERDPEPEARFDYRVSQYYLRLPVINAIFEQIGDASKLRALDLTEVLSWAGDALNRVDRAAFFAAFEKGHAVQYFYEPFLEAFDPALRKQMGVWYTPPEIVQYMVARVDTVLREELGVADGLADPNVVVLDPCAGTGAYLVEVLKRIAATLRANGEGALLGHTLAQAAHERIFGFEILPASYVVAHMQLGLLLQDLGATGPNVPRPGMYLTNALTGWGDGATQKKLSNWPELAAERDAAEKVKHEQKILVILGNPPYNAFTGVSPAQEEGLVEPYKKGLVKEWGIKKFNLDDLYVRFFRLAERRIAEFTGRGVVCFISNASYLSDPSFVVMRQRLLREFDALWFDNMNGDSRETGKLTPEGKPDPSVFSTDFNREGIRVGTAIGVMVRRQKRAAAPTVGYQEYWGVTKRADLLASLAAPDFDAQYEIAAPAKGNRFSLRVIDASGNYAEWPKLPDICGGTISNGLLEKRGGALIDIDRSALEKRMRMYFDRSIEWQELADLQTGLTEDAARFDAKRARKKVLASENFAGGRIRKYVLRPMDTRWCYFSPIRPLWNEPRPTLWAQSWPANSFLMCRPVGVADPEGVPFYFTRLLGDNDFLRGHAYYIPALAYVQPAEITQSGADAEAIPPQPNLSAVALKYLQALGLADPHEQLEIAEVVWLHALAIGYSPAYLTENADGIRMDWPRIPLPNSREQLLASAALGRRVAALLDTETPVTGVTSGTVRAELRQIGVLEGSSPLNLTITAGWGSAGKEGVTMPGRGSRTQRAPEPGEVAAGLGESTHDVYLNPDTYWRNIPDRVWNYYIGGYQVIKKWLSYREAKLLGRAITPDEAREVRDMARRLAAIVLLEPELDANYQAVKANTYAWPQV